MIAWQERVRSEALTWLGTPYHHQGRVKGVGVDCGQILIAIYEKAEFYPLVSSSLVTIRRIWLCTIMKKNIWHGCKNTVILYQKRRLEILYFFSLGVVLVTRAL